MAEEQTPDAPPEGDQEQQGKETFDADYVQKLRAEAAKYRTQAKENSSAAQRLAELEEASKSESQKQAERLAAAEARVKEFETREQVSAWAAEVVDGTPIPASALRGSTREELEAHFEQLKALIPETPATPPGLPGPYVPNAGKTPTTPLNGDPLLDALKSKLGIS